MAIKLYHAIKNKASGDHWQYMNGQHDDVEKRLTVQYGLYADPQSRTDEPRETIDTISKTWNNTDFDESALAVIPAYDNLIAPMNGDLSLSLVEDDLLANHSFLSNGVQVANA